MASGRHVFLRSASIATVIVALAGAVTSAQEVAPKGDPRKGAAPPEVAKRTLTIEVVVASPGEKAKPQAVANAIVRIEGAEDARDTNAQGRARFSGITADKVSVQIMAVGADLCRLADIALGTGDQLMKVLVDPSPKKERCRRVE